MLAIMSDMTALTGIKVKPKKKKPKDKEENDSPTIDGSTIIRITNALQRNANEIPNDFRKNFKIRFIPRSLQHSHYKNNGKRLLHRVLWSHQAQMFLDLPFRERIVCSRTDSI